ncbi:MerR family transcriptional regulator [Bacillus mojavensis]|uniref:MerR family transcriptional regulator n=1 Tax=Bacillus mojavensis TaxID=72360 RepID=UPI002DBD29D8|nr:MerR family transcriptional regulator [Bacillus mojavensis]MEC1611859.1 MerR family transcriptional regulator [Bacillus mojavensis]MEC1621547.1 MerR family transcriptional regulator [Bacillus mojavensis]MEC1659815.1 MerR family transcriptional regulator [Bacillus mojavensis]MEC1683785.1 MerR family transcriptional regulator [Bacillus mojavensis]MEC1690735.1 MerR family transcriptional regulator [Bacillus mojavensis]
MYTIGQVSKLTGFTIDTLRYYEKIGLLPAPSRNEKGIRVYFPKDIETITLIKCLRKTGLSIEEMTEFMQARGLALAHKTPISEEYLSSVRKKIGILSKHVIELENKRREIEQVISLTKNKINSYQDMLNQS